MRKFTARPGVTLLAHRRRVGLPDAARVHDRDGVQGRRSSSTTPGRAALSGGRPRPSSARAPSYPVYDVPTARRRDQGAGRSSSRIARTASFIDPANPEAGPIPWVGPLADAPAALDASSCTFDNFATAWDVIDFPRLLFNTLVDRDRSATIGAVAVGDLRRLRLQPLPLPRPQRPVPADALDDHPAVPGHAHPDVRGLLGARLGRDVAAADRPALLRERVQRLPAAAVLPDDPARARRGGDDRRRRPVPDPALGHHPAGEAGDRRGHPVPLLLRLERLLPAADLPPGQPDLQPLSVGLARFNALYSPGADAHPGRARSWRWPCRSSSSSSPSARSCAASSSPASRSDSAGSRRGRETCRDPGRGLATRSALPYEGVGRPRVDAADDRRRAVGRRPDRRARRGQHRPDAPRRLRPLAPRGRRAPLRAGRRRPVLRCSSATRPASGAPHVLSTIRPTDAARLGLGPAGRRRHVPRALPACLGSSPMGCARPSGSSGEQLSARSSRRRPRVGAHCRSGSSSGGSRTGAATR